MVTVTEPSAVSRSSLTVATLNTALASPASTVTSSAPRLPAATNVPSWATLSATVNAALIAGETLTVKVALPPSVAGAPAAMLTSGTTVVSSSSMAKAPLPLPTAPPCKFVPELALSVPSATDTDSLKPSSASSSVEASVKVAASGDGPVKVMLGVAPDKLNARPAGTGFGAVNA